MQQYPVFRCFQRKEAFTADEKMVIQEVQEVKKTQQWQIFKLCI